ncbi:MAG: NAD(+)/NADH kinase [Verrucomicrobiota bacterium]
MNPIKNLAFVSNASKQGAGEFVEELRSIARERGIHTVATNEFPVPDGFLKGMDACCVVGGDGTFLSVAAESTQWQVPLVGVNFGTLGFLTTYTTNDFKDQLGGILEGKCDVNYRSLLQCQIQENHCDYALNDVVVKAKGSGHIVHVDVFADDEFVTTYICDGLIFSTPTGSTAYTLSAGGPMVHPSAGVVSLTPICAHTLSNRSIIFPQGVKLRIENAKKAEPLMIAIDGQRNMSTLDDRPVEIWNADKKLPMVQRVDYSHFKVVRRKLKWNGGYAGQE